VRRHFPVCRTHDPRSRTRASHSGPLPAHTYLHHAGSAPPRATSIALTQQPTAPRTGAVPGFHGAWRAGRPGDLVPCEAGDKPELLAAVRPCVDGCSTNAAVNHVAVGRRWGDRSPRSGPWRAGSVSRWSRRPSRRTSIATARPSPRRGQGTLGSRSSVAEQGGRWRRGHMDAVGNGPSCGGVMLASGLALACPAETSSQARGARRGNGQYEQG
jgi:hypothetical protein